MVVRILVEAIKSKDIKLFLYPDEEASGVIEVIKEKVNNKTEDGRRIVITFSNGSVDAKIDAKMYAFLIFLFLELRELSRNDSNNSKWMRFFEVTPDMITEWVELV
jgi:hypothetical protein